ncbi:MAG: SPOR domain-containing protein [Pseudoflavonifractor sp.]|nr:SPOR domain-containing protein [Alloprevotella sp.]MCM1116638.1 SPOR domain-containing protein [Pseudoflavonifractor sp.]
MTKKIYSIVTAITVGVVAAYAVSIREKADTTVTIISEITLGGRNTVAQPEALTRLLECREKGETADETLSSEAATRQRTGGYRVQVFLDNNPSTAKSSAHSRANAVSSRFPEYRTYVTYNAPYWRLRVGDFKTQAEAAEAAEALRAAFPRSAKEIRVVRDNIIR